MKRKRKPSVTALSQSRLLEHQRKRLLQSLRITINDATEQRLQMCELNDDATGFYSSHEGEDFIK